MFRFTTRDVLWLTAVVALVLALIYQKRPVSPPPIHRYQIVSDQKQDGYLFLIDTATGKIWRRYQGSWEDDRSPALVP